MTRINQKNIKYTICVVVLIIIAYYSRALHTEVENPIFRMFLVMTRSVIQISLVIAWCSSIITRIINKQVRCYLIAVGIMLAFWLILRTCKWEFIAEKLYISLRTVKGYVQSMREKTGFRNRTELAVRARESVLVINNK